MSEPIRLVTADAQEVGSYFVANYPPFSVWSRDAVVTDARPALATPPAAGTPLGLYLHIPFCRKRCHFCYFRVYTDKNADDVAAYLDLLVREWEMYATQTTGPDLSPLGDHSLARRRAAAERARARRRRARGHARAGGAVQGERAVGVRVRGADAVDREVRARVVIDASGQQAMLHGDLLSLGIVAPFADLFKVRASHEQTYGEEVQRCPIVKERLAGATRVAGYFATKDYSYRSKVVAGDGWVLVGDAFGFLDPLYSSGVLLALKSGQLAADTSGAQLGKWGGTFNQGVDRMRRLVCEDYGGFSFGEFVRRSPEPRNTLTDLLIGDLFTSKPDTVWAPIESTYKPGRRAIPAWREGLEPEMVPAKANELFLPDGRRP